MVEKKRITIDLGWDNWNDDFRWIVDMLSCIFHEIVKVFRHDHSRKIVLFCGQLLLLILPSSEWNMYININRERERESEWEREIWAVVFEMRSLVCLSQRKWEIPSGYQYQFITFLRSVSWFGLVWFWASI